MEWNEAIIAELRVALVSRFVEQPKSVAAWGFPRTPWSGRRTVLTSRRGPRRSGGRSATPTRRRPPGHAQPGRALAPLSVPAGAHAPAAQPAAPVVRPAVAAAAHRCNALRRACGRPAAGRSASQESRASISVMPSPCMGNPIAPSMRSWPMSKSGIGVKTPHRRLLDAALRTRFSVHESHRRRHHLAGRVPRLL